MITSHELPYTEIIKSEGDFFSADVTLPVQGAIFQYSKTGFIPGPDSPKKSPQLPYKGGGVQKLTWVTGMVCSTTSTLYKLYFVFTNRVEKLVSHALEQNEKTSF